MWLKVQQHICDKTHRELFTTEPLNFLHWKAPQRARHCVFSIGGHSRGHFITFCPLKGHPKGHWITFPHTQRGSNKHTLVKAVFWQHQYGWDADINVPMLHHWRQSNMTWLCFGSLLMYYVATTGMCECSVRVNGQGCSVGDGASKRHKWLYFVIWNSWQKSLKHQRWVLSFWPWDKCDRKVHPAKPRQPQQCHPNLNLKNTLTQTTPASKWHLSDDLESLDWRGLVL